MDLIIALIVLILIVILFNKVAQLKKMIDFQDLKIKNLQEQLQKQSTTELTTVEIDKVVDTLTRHLGQNTGVTVEFPSVESILRKQDLEQMSRGKG